MKENEKMDTIETLEEALLEFEKARQKSREQEMSRGSFSFRLRRDLVLNLSKDKSPKTPKINLSGLFEEKDSYLDYDLEPGLHVVFGPAATGKSLFLGQIRDSFKIPYVGIFEHIPNFKDEDVGIEPLDIVQAVETNLESGVVIIDSLRIISLIADDYPAIMRGVSTVNFTFAQWLSLVAAKKNMIIIAAMSTELKDESVVAIYKDFLSGGPRSVWLMQGFGEGQALIKSRERGTYVKFSLRNKGTWLSKKAEGNNLLSFTEKLIRS